MMKFNKTKIPYELLSQQSYSQVAITRSSPVCAYSLFFKGKIYKITIKNKMNDYKEIQELCPLHNGGCDFQGSKKSLDEHMKSNLETHLLLACKIIREQSELITAYREKLKLEEVEKSRFDQRLETLTRDLETLRTEYSKEREERSRDTKQLTEKLELQHEYQAHVNDELRMQIHGLKRRGDSGGNQTLETNASVLTSSTVMSPSPKLVKEDEEKRLKKEDSPVPSMNSLLSRFTVHRAEFVWRLNAFSRKLRKLQSGGHDDPYISDPFATGPYGYRVSAWLYLNGRGKGAGKCLSVYVRVMVGEFDPVLTWPIRPCYTFMLLDQTPDSARRQDHIRVRDLTNKPAGIERPRKDDKSVIVGYDDFIVHEELENKNYLVDDCIFIKIVVEIPE